MKSPMMIQMLPWLICSIWALIGLPVLANQNTLDRPPHTGGRSAGSRGCSTNLTSANLASAVTDEPTLILLAPSPDVGQTVSPQPIFSWVVRDSGTWPMVFRIYQYLIDRGEYVLVTEVTDDAFKSGQGVNVLALSEETSTLSPGVTYLWQVELICDPSQPSGNLFAEAEIEVVEPSMTLRQQLIGNLGEASDEFHQATVYHEAGFWYDALGITLISQPTPELSDFKTLLLESVSGPSDESGDLNISSIHIFQR